MVAIPDYVGYPGKIRTLREITAANPWRGGEATLWSICLYRMMDRDYAVKIARGKLRVTVRDGDVDPIPGGRLLKRREVIGLETPDGQVRLLPRALIQRWHEGAVSDRDLAALLHTLERRLLPFDFVPPPLPLPIFYALLAVPCAVFLYALSWPVLPAAYAPGPGDKGILPVVVAIAAIMLVTILLIGLRPRLRHRWLLAIIDKQA